MPTELKSDASATGYIVKDWTGLEAGAEPVTLILKPGDIFECLDSARRENRQIAVYVIGPCVLDWSKPCA